MPNMGRVSFTGARTGKRKGRSLGGFVERFDFEIGETKRIVFPVITNSEGEKELVILAEPIHHVKQGFIEYVGQSGKPFKPYKVRCMHPYSQTDANVARQSAERKEMCPFCELANLERRQLYSTMEERYGEEGFKDLSKEEQKEFYQEMESMSQVEESYYKKEDSDGNSYTVNRLDITVLAFELETKITVNDAGRNVLSVIYDEAGFPKYKKILMPMSQSRLDKFKNAAETAFESESLSAETHSYAFIEGEGDDAEEVTVGFVDFLVKFPQKADKKESAKDMTPHALPTNKSVITTAFVEKVQADSEKLLAEAEKAFKALNPTLKALTPTEAIGLMVDDGEYYRGMKNAFGKEEDAEYYDNVFTTVLNRGGNAPEQEEEQAPEEAPQQATQQPAQTQATQPKPVAPTQAQTQPARPTPPTPPAQPTQPAQTQAQTTQATPPQGTPADVPEMDISFEDFTV